VLGSARIRPRFNGLSASKIWEPTSTPSIIVATFYFPAVPHLAATADTVAQFRRRNDQGYYPSRRTTKQTGGYWQGRVRAVQGIHWRAAATMPTLEWRSGGRQRCVQRGQAVSRPSDSAILQLELNPAHGCRQSRAQRLSARTPIRGIDPNQRQIEIRHCFSTPHHQRDGAAQVGGLAVTAGLRAGARREI